MNDSGPPHMHMLSAGNNRAITTYKVQGCCQDGGIRDGAWFTAVQQELEALHALADRSQVHNVLGFSCFLFGGQVIIKAMAT